MNAIQFIKEKGVDKAREVIDGAPDLWTTYTTAGVLGGYIRCSGSAGQDEVSISDLKRLVESVDLVESYGGVGLLEYQVRCLGQELSDALKQAIADYELLFCSGESK